jgi:hypothetical protein
MVYLATVLQLCLLLSSCTSRLKWTPCDGRREGLSVMDALDICKKCIAEIKERFIMDCGSYTVKLVDKDGVRVINLEDGSTVTDASSMDTAA